MAAITVKGHVIEPVIVKDSFSRRAVQFRNKIIELFKEFGLTEDNVEIPLEAIAMKKAKASASWWMEGHHLHYSYNGFKFVDNLYIVLRVLELEVAALKEGKRTLEEFLQEFSEDDDIHEQRIEARKTLGLDENTRDMDLINKTYKQLSKESHPDMATGNIDRFKEINKAHKILKRELE